MTRADVSSELTVASNHNDKARGCRRIGVQLHGKSRCFQMACGGRTDEVKYVPRVWPLGSSEVVQGFVHPPFEAFVCLGIPMQVELRLERDVACGTRRLDR